LFGTEEKKKKKRRRSRSKNEKEKSSFSSPRKRQSITNTKFREKKYKNADFGLPKFDYSLLNRITTLV
jgi:hypothetical protein